MKDIAPSTVDEARRGRFEAAWQAHGPTRLEDFLPHPSDSTFLPTLEELVHIDLELAWKRRDGERNGLEGSGSSNGSGPFVEEYVRRFPVLDEEDILKRLVTQEFRVRSRYGDHPAMVEYQERFPAMRFSLAEMDDLVGMATRMQGGQANPAVAERYRLIEICGKGAFGAVWRAKDRELDREVAVKQLHESHSDYTDARSRFVQEAKITAKLDHPGVIPVHSLGKDRDTPQYAMKLVRGGTLADAISRFHALPQKSVERAVEQIKLLSSFLVVTRTMEFAHARGVIHRDLKPANISLGEFGETLVVDWGLAKELRGDAHSESPTSATEMIRRTQKGERKGTPAYMSPEQVMGDIDMVDHRSDVYSLGVILYELLTGRLPFDSRDALDLMQMVVDETPPSPRSLVISISRPLAAICLKSLAKRREDRYQCVRDLRADLERYLADEPVSCYSETVAERLFRWSRHHRAVTMAVGMLLIGLSAASLLFALASLF